MAVVLSILQAGLTFLYPETGLAPGPLGLRLVGHDRDMLGARVEIVRPGKPSLWRRSRADGSYASASDPRVLVGLGDSSDRVTVRVRWPDGKTETWTDQAIDRYVTLRQGEGK